MAYFLQFSEAGLLECVANRASRTRSKRVHIGKIHVPVLGTRRIDNVSSVCPARRIAPAILAERPPRRANHVAVLEMYRCDPIND